MGGEPAYRTHQNADEHQWAPVGLSDSTLELVRQLDGRSYEYGLSRQQRPSERVRQRLVRLRRDSRSHRTRIDRAPEMSGALADIELAGVDRRVIVGLQLLQTARTDLARDTVALRLRIADLAADLEREGFSPTDFGLPLVARARHRLSVAEQSHRHEVGLLRKLKRAVERLGAHS